MLRAHAMTKLIFGFFAISRGTVASKHGVCLCVTGACECAERQQAVKKLATYRHWRHWIRPSCVVRSYSSLGVKITDTTHIRHRLLVDCRNEVAGIVA
jgi:hypothetical protein